MRCRLNGSDVTTITTRIERPNGLCVDTDTTSGRSSSLYVLEGDSGSLFHCDLMLSTVNYGQFIYIQTSLF